MMKFITDDKYKSNLDIASNYQIKKFADKTTEAFELITGVNYHKLSREDKEVVRHKYIDFAESQKRIFNEDIWVNALFADYNPVKCKFPSYCECSATYDHNDVIEGKDWWQYASMDEKCMNGDKWLITDVRFPNEYEAIKDRGGIVIRVNKEKFSYQSDLPETASPIEHAERGKELHYHSSETALDDYEFDYVIENNDSIEELVEKVKQLNLV